MSQIEEQATKLRSKTADAGAKGAAALASLSTVGTRGAGTVLDSAEDEAALISFLVRCSGVGLGSWPLA